jgi:hypothetical protein
MAHGYINSSGIPRNGSQTDCRFAFADAGLGWRGWIRTIDLWVLSEMMDYRATEKNRLNPRKDYESGFVHCVRFGSFRLQFAHRLRTLTVLEVRI